MRPADLRFLMFLVFVLAFGRAALADDAPKKAAVPNEKAQAETLKLIKEVYGGEYAEAKAIAAKQALAKKLLDKANETTDDPVAKYVLLRLSRDIAVQVADCDAAFEAIDSLAEGYEVNAAEMKLAALTNAASAAKTPLQQKALAEEALKVADAAIATDDFTLADRLETVALAQSRKLRDKELISQAQGRIDETARAAKAFEAVAAAKAALPKNADDPDARLVVGKYLCLVKADWDNGLPMLARGSDEALKKLVAKELEQAVSSTDQAKLGDGWWEAAEKENEAARKAMRARAVYWYQQALPGLSGLAGDKVKMRVEQATATMPAEARRAEPSPIEEPSGRGTKGRTGKGGKNEVWISKDATYSASSALSDERPALPSLLNESEQFHYGKFALDTKFEAGAHIVIDLGKRMTITRVYIQNRSDPELYGRAKGLTVWLSESTDKRVKAIWTAPAPAAEWDVVLRRPVAARYVTIGLPPNIANQLDLRKIKIFGHP